MAQPVDRAAVGLQVGDHRVPPGADRLEILAGAFLDRCRGEGPPNCVSRCPLGVDARAYVQLARAGRFADALQKVRERLPFPGILGYLCTHPCEYHCKRIDQDSAVRIRDIKRFLAEREEGPPAHLLERSPDREQTVAVVGGGPGGLLAAHDLGKRGYRVTVFERDRDIGGCLRSRIPTWRLPARVRERDFSIIGALGITVETGCELGRDVALEELVDGYDAVLLAIGFDGSRRFLAGAGRELRRTIRGTLRIDPASGVLDARRGVFAAGDAVSGPSTVVEAMGMARRAADAIHHRFTSTAGSDHEHARSGRLLWKLDIGEAERAERLRLPEMLVPFSPAMSAEEVYSESERCLDCHCEQCREDCEFLAGRCSSPIELAQRVLSQPLDRGTVRMAYSCTACSLCAKVCPVGLDTGELLAEVRRAAVRAGVGPLPEHRSVIRRFTTGVSPRFTLVRPEPGRRRGGRLLFTGCTLPEVSPIATLRLYDLLRRSFPGIGVVMQCCGAPMEVLGMVDESRGAVRRLRRAVEELRTEELVTTCPECARFLARAMPDLEITSAWELLAGTWEPPPLENTVRLAVHDPCRAREMKGAQDAVRALIHQRGASVEEDEYSRDLARCCGHGSRISLVDRDLARKVARRCGGGGDLPIVTYCAGCSMALSGVGKNVVHLLDLLLDERWEVRGRRAVVPGHWRRSFNRMRTKAAFERLRPLGEGRP